MLELARHLSDCSLFILIWIVQLTIYPSFQFMSAEQLIQWHAKYTERMAWIAGPLILFQTTIISIQIVLEISIINILSGIIVGVTWILTYFVSIPLHRTISKDGGSLVELNKLVNTNWYRTICWSVLFAIGWVQ